MGEFHQGITFTNPNALPINVSYNINGGSNSIVAVGASGSITVPASTVTPGIFTYNLVSVSYQTAPFCSQPIPDSLCNNPCSSTTDCHNYWLNKCLPKRCISFNKFSNPQNLPVAIRIL
jgi:hypothetical protein